MKKKDVHVRHRYAAKVSGEMTTVRILGENPYGGWDAVNERTGRKVRIRSAQRLRYEVRNCAGPSPEYKTRAEMFGREDPLFERTADNWAKAQPWSKWTGRRARNKWSGETFIATSSEDWAERLAVWRAAVRGYERAADCPCPSPMSEGHIMFEGRNVATYEVLED
jgi:hypothetical protein